MRSLPRCLAASAILFALLAVGLAVPRSPADDEPAPRKAVETPAAKEASDMPSAEDIARWIKDLHSDRFVVREKAMKALEKAGEPALKPLAEAEKSSALEVQRRARQLIDRIETAAAVGPTLVRLNLKDTPVPKAVEELSRQGRLKLELLPQQGPGRQQLEGKKITLDLGRVPYWEALEKLCAAAGLTYAPRDVNTLQLQACEGGPALRVPTATSGAFRLRVTALNYHRGLTFPGAGGPPGVGPAARSESLSATLDVMAEPHIKVLGLGTPSIQEARDEEGQSLVLPGVAGGPINRSHAFYGGPMVVQIMQTTANLRPPTRPAATLKVLKGVLSVEVMSHRKPLVRVDKILAGKKKVFEGKNGLTLVLLQVQEQGPQNGNIRFALTGDWAKVRGEIQGAGQPNNLEAFRPCFELTDADGRPLNVNVNFNYMPFPNQGQDVLEGNLYYSAGANTGAPTRFSFYGFRRVQVSLPFELRDVPLP
jgi:hypothetical protein